MADTVVPVQDRAEAAVIAATGGCRQALAKIGNSIATCRVPQWTWKVSEVATPPNVTRAMIWRYRYHQSRALAEGGGQALEDAVVPDIVETFPNVQIRAIRGAVLLPRFVEKGQRAHNKRCIPLQSWRLGDFLSIGAQLVKQNCFIKLDALHFACATGHVTGGTRGKSHAKRLLTS